MVVGPIKHKSVGIFGVRTGVLKLFHRINTVHRTRSMFYQRYVFVTFNSRRILITTTICISLARHSNRSHASDDHLSEHQNVRCCFGSAFCIVLAAFRAQGSVRVRSSRRVHASWQKCSCAAQFRFRVLCFGWENERWLVFMCLFVFRWMDVPQIVDCYRNQQVWSSNLKRSPR